MRKVLLKMLICIEVAIIMFTQTVSVYQEKAPAASFKEKLAEALASESVSTTVISSSAPSAQTEVPAVTPSVAAEQTEETSKPSTNTTVSVTAQTTVPAVTRPAKIVPPPTTAAVTSVPPTTKTIENTYKPDSSIRYPMKTFETKSKEVAITFDDGYNEEAIKKVLEVSKEHGIKLTFFVVGALLKEYPELWKQSLEDGHEICNHTYGHSMLTALDDEAVLREITKWETVAENVLGEGYVAKMKSEYPFIRLPFGSGSSDKRILETAAEAGYIPVGWAVETCYAVLRHYNLKSADTDEVSEHVFSHIVSTVKSGRIILLHFNPYDTGKLDEIFSQIIDKGYDIKLLSEVLMNQ